MIRLYLSLLVFLGALVFAALASATTPERQPEYSLLNVISPGGGFVCGEPDYDLLFTLGEPVVGASLYADSLLLWSGFVPIRCTCTLCPGVTRVADPVPEGNPLARLYLVGPNPATRIVRIMCELPDGESTHLAVYDALGRQVRVIHEGPLPAGAHEMHWDGRNDSGTRVAAGVYYARFAAGSTVLTEKVVFVR